MVFGQNQESEKFDSSETGWHWKGHLKRSRMVQISPLYIAPSSEEL